jgi:hypothetical protein
MCECAREMTYRTFAKYFYNSHIRTSAHQNIRPMSRRLDKYEKLPVYKKSQELFDLVDVISEALKEDEMKESLAVQMCSNAALIQAKIAGAEGGGLYSLRMQNAVLIPYHSPL